MSMTTELAQIKCDIAARKAMPGFGPDTSIERLRIINATQKSFSLETVEALVEALEARDKQVADSENRVGKQNRHICELFDDNTALRQRIIELEEKLETVDKLQDSAFRHGLQHGFSLGQTDNQAGFEQCMAAYSQKEKSNG